MSAASKPHSDPGLLAESISPGGYMPTWTEAALLADAYNSLVEQYEAQKTKTFEVAMERRAAWDEIGTLKEQFETAQNAMKEALAALMVGQPDRPRALHNAERILRAALAKRLEIETSHEPSQMDWPEGTPHVL